MGLRSPGHHLRDRDEAFLTRAAVFDTPRLMLCRLLGGAGDVLCEPAEMVPHALRIGSIASKPLARVCAWMPTHSAVNASGRCGASSDLEGK